VAATQARGGATRTRGAECRGGPEGDRGARAYPSGGRASSLRRSPSSIARAARPAALRAQVQARPSRVRSGRGGGARGAIGGEKAHLSATELHARDRVPVERCAAHSTGGASGPQGSRRSMRTHGIPRAQSRQSPVDTNGVGPDIAAKYKDPMLHHDLSDTLAGGWTSVGARRARVCGTGTERAHRE
jgi:hypothetical protein